MEQALLRRSSPALVSVVIPSFNSGRFVDETVRTVLAQTYARTEVIVVDDGSTDDTREKLRSFGSAIRVVEQANHGRCVARNRGLSEARGDFVVFLDSDDLLEPEHVETLLGVMQHERCDVAYAKAAHFIDDTDRPRFSFRLRYFEKDEASRIILNNFMETGVAMIRRDFLRAVGTTFRFGEYAEDWDFWIRLVLAGARVRFVDRVLVLCREHASNTRRNPTLIDRAALRCLDGLQEEFRASVEQRGLGEYFERARTRIRFRIASELVFRGETSDGRRMLRDLARSLFRLRPVDLARFPAVCVLSVVPIPLPVAVIRVVFGQQCALEHRLAALPLKSAAGATQGRWQ